MAKIHLQNGWFIFSLFILAALFSSCEEISSPGVDTGIEDSLDEVEDVQLISGADNVTLIVNGSTMSYFALEFRGIQPNIVMENGIREGWCIDWKTPISSQNGIYHGIKLYSTYGVEKWKELNAFLNMKDEMTTADETITFREIQAAIWVLRPHPAFDLENLNLKDLPSDMVRNGELLFNPAKVIEIVQAVKSRAKSFSYTVDTRFAVIAETPVDVQTVITVAVKR